MDPQHKTYAQYKRVLAGQQAPYAVLDLDLLDANIEAVLQRAGDKPIRIATKSIRCCAVLRHILKSSPRFQGLMSFTAAESLFLLEQGFDDLLVGYPTTDTTTIAALVQAIGQGKRVTFMADHVDQLQLLSRAGEEHGVTVPWCLDLDVSTRFPGLHFGAYRSPLHSSEEVRQLLDRVDGLPNLHLRGLMGYEGQIAGVGDRPHGVDLRTRVIRLLKRSSIAELRERRRAVVELLRARYPLMDLINGGGTGSLESTREEAWVTEVTVGSAFFAPALFDSYTAFQHLPTLCFALPVVRIPKPGMVTCLGGGYPASGPAGPSRLPQPYLPQGLRYVPAEGAGEVQTPLYDPSGQLSIGDPVFFRHAKAGELCERFDRLFVVQGEKVLEETMSTYRGDGHCFL
ncbi:MAG: amino acid deaminase/aldolase [Flavobacteriales bacterium]